MEFLEILALAREKQEKRDKEVKRMVQEENLKKARLREVEKMRAATNFSFTAKKDDVSTQEVSSTPPPTCTSSQEASCVRKPTKPSLKVQPREPPALPVTSAPSGVTSGSGPPPNVPVKSAPKSRSNLSFAELLELAKKNVPSDAGKRIANEELLPCPLDSTYRSLDSTIPPKKKLTSNPRHVPSGKSSGSHTSTAKVTNHVVQQVTPCSVGPPTSAVSNVVSSTNGPKSSVCLSSVKRVSTHSSNLNSSDRKGEVSSKCSKGAIADQLHSGKLCVAHNASKLRIEKGCAALGSHKSVSGSNKDNDVGEKVARSMKRPIAEPQVTRKALVTKTSSNNALTSSLNSPAPRVSHKTLSANGGPKRCSSILPQTAPVRGIAAQLGSSLSNRREFEAVDSPEMDEYESDDSFIDDSEAMESKEYARVVRDVHKALKFDPRKYKEVNPWDDLRSMEANFRDIDREERRSARLAAQEDAAELEKEMLRKKQKKGSFR